jgi:hypothetical protein
MKGWMDFGEVGLATEVLREAVGQLCPKKLGSSSLA